MASVYLRSSSSQASQLSALLPASKIELNLHEVPKALHDLGLHVDPNHAPVGFKVLHPLQGRGVDQFLVHLTSRPTLLSYYALHDAAKAFHQAAPYSLAFAMPSSTQKTKQA